MAGLKARVEALEAKTPNSSTQPRHVELMAYTDARTQVPAPAGPYPGAVTRIILTPLTRQPTTTRGAAHGYA